MRRSSCATTPETKIKTMQPTAYPVRARIDVRWRDFDALKVVGVTAYFTYLEIARTTYYQKVFGSTELSGIDFMVVSAACDHLRPIRRLMTLDVGVAVSRVGKTSFDFDYHLTEMDGGAALAHGRTTQVLYDYGAKVKIPLSEKWLECVRAAQGGLPPTSIAASASLVE